MKFIKIIPIICNSFIIIKERGKRDLKGFIQTDSNKYIVVNSYFSDEVKVQITDLLNHDIISVKAKAYDLVIEIAKPIEYEEIEFEV
ncbi:hypothetical protein [Clostridium sp.]|uniref:hypothetical protein n=1 Tax=Clostridium sp. TaxID=1506 RepID=UPI001A3A8DC9|nr:hypothetical protein [Clostridium sp.]MBK5234028.1 hypothetical protein [Clostridium sp.]